ncbi:Malolactic regulator [Lacticaseibacillus rhamnosus LRHMDP2]|uniref:Malolactic regulator n=1 Tax=Lacticaseibacillus rhamnosus LRHMDP3 TaxID=1203259 RepID=A0AB33XSZ9_LACRH|nr:Malolactic regulator [Lacticaseibacillus rhamnosus LRHMDP3]EKS51184.1 Malolactic regulator [Lacticaseibacillus rhamnosus LRHMDP2]
MAITSEANRSAFTPITRSPAQKSACKDLIRNGQDRVITDKAAYTPVSNRAGPRLPSLFVQLPFCGYNDKEQSGKELPL